ncbi:MAG: hypothetical protein A2Y25_00395 [Candidatus Melainabacteria bacterium GWF2_37_15]|nr:MAG: hypothetical protein A2Y25_00395 [Candidatus Melainabacteria bacterium GWF2_37_15]
MFNNLLNQDKAYINRWIVPYADFVTMLLALFMVMYALSQMDVNNLKEFSYSLENVFNLQSKENLVEIFKTTEIKVAFSAMENNIKEEVIEFENIKGIVEEKLNKIENVSIIREPRGLLIRLSNTVLFDTGSDIIKGESTRVLDTVAEALKNVPNSIRIEGHTDNIPIETSRFPSNWELSTSRATNLVRYLIEKHGLQPAKLSAIGYGEYMPLGDNDSEQKRALNRRVDIVILSSSYDTE